MDDVLDNDNSSNIEKYEDEDEDEDENENENENVIPSGMPTPYTVPNVPIEVRRGTGRVFPTKFTPPSNVVDPFLMFPWKMDREDLLRFVHRYDLGKVLVFTDGACLDNGQQNPRDGWAFHHGAGLAGNKLIQSGKLESVGPFGDPGAQTSNALRHQAWDREGFNTIVIATDSEYVTQGATVWTKTWIKNGWQKNDRPNRGRQGSGNTDVKNKDLWEALLGEVERWHDKEVSIQFWRIPREWNTDVDAAAKSAAEPVMPPIVLGPIVESGTFSKIGQA